MAKEQIVGTEDQVVNLGNTATVAVLIMAHAPLATALKDVAEHVFGEAIDITAIDVLPGACVADSSHALASRLMALDKGAGVLVLTDLPGASPANICVEAAQRLNDNAVGCAVVTGVNASMVVRVLSYRKQPLEVLAQQAVEGALQTVTRLN